MQMKRCSKCKHIKPLTEFSVDKRKKDGHRYHCKSCNAEYRRQYYIVNGDKSRERCRRNYAKDPARHRERARRYREVNPDCVRRQYTANPNCYREASLRWRKAHPEKRREQENRRRARKANAPGSYCQRDLDRQYESQGGLCFWCSEALKPGWHADHVIALSRDGSNWPENIVCSCVNCNNNKKAKIPFLEWQPPKPLKQLHEIPVIVRYLSA